MLFNTKVKIKMLLFFLWKYGNLFQALITKTDSKVSVKWVFIIYKQNSPFQAVDFYGFPVVENQPINRTGALFPDNAPAVVKDGSLGAVTPLVALLLTTLLLVGDETGGGARSSALLVLHTVLTLESWLLWCHNSFAKRLFYFCL